MLQFVMRRTALRAASMRAGTTRFDVSVLSHALTQRRHHTRDAPVGRRREAGVAKWWGRGLTLRGMPVRQAPFCRAVRLFATTERKEEEGKPKTFEDYVDSSPEVEEKGLFIRKINYLLEHHSSCFATSYFGQRTVFFILFTWLFSDIYMLSGAEFVLAWLFTRFTAKFRVPTNLFLALCLRKLFPILETIHFSNILIYKPDVARLGREDLSVQEKRRLKRQKGTIIQGDNETPYPEDQLKHFRLKHQVARGMEVKWQRRLETWRLHEGKLSQEEKRWRRSVFEAEKLKYFRRAEWFEWIRDQVAGPIDRMGMSWYLTAKTSSFCSILGVALAVRYGFDVQGYLVHGLGFREDVDNFAGAMAASLLFNTFLVPVHFLTANVFTRVWTGDFMPGDDDSLAIHKATDPLRETGLKF